MTTGVSEDFAFSRVSLYCASAVTDIKRSPESITEKTAVFFIVIYTKY
jgi:hypothetical protein